MADEKEKDDSAKEDAPKRAVPRKVDDPDASMKEWVRRELHLAANGVSEERRKEVNP